MVSKVNSFAFNGIYAQPVTVECQLASGMVNFTIVGLPDKAVAESRDRIRSVFSSLGLSVPAKKIIINLSPADLYKEGSHYDLPIILALFVEMKIIKQSAVDDYFLLGELSLDGTLNRVKGVLPASLEANRISKGIICPLANAQEALWADEEMPLIAAHNLTELLNYLKNITQPPKVIKNKVSRKSILPDFKDVKGQKNVKRAAEIAACGQHNMLMNGSPGTGKSMIASRIASILPEFTNEEILEASIIASVAGTLSEDELVYERPYRAPHHNISMPAMIGGGSKIKPGEVSLAHKGVLFLDELPEFPRQVLDSLRQPIEEGAVTVSRVNSHVTYPADFQLIAAMNPCKCGYFGADESLECSKAPKCAEDYQNRLSGPLLDRFDIFIDVTVQNPMLAYETDAEAETSEEIRKRVIKVRKFQAERYKNESFYLNSHLKGDNLIKYCALTDEAKELLRKAVTNLRISMRGHARILRLARTIADMDFAEVINKNHIAEAVSYRKL